MSVQQDITEKLQQAFAPRHLAVDNESHMHAGPADAQTHFRVVLVSDVFDALRPVARHQRVYAALGDELAGPVHALALHTYTPGEWAARGEAPQSPDCLGGSAAEKRQPGGGS